MAPYRPSGRTNRSGRTQVDHDVFEGLPIRQWQQVETSVGLPTETPATQQKNAWPELAMPLDAHFLPAWSQQLLRVARAGKMYENTTRITDDEAARQAKKPKQPLHGFLSKKWSQVPRHLEGPEREYLAKRRKGLPSVRSGAAGSSEQVGAMRKTKVRRADAEGNVKVWEVLLPEGQTVEGEIHDEAAAAQAVVSMAAPGTVIEGLGVVNADGIVVASDATDQAPIRRRPPPPRRKPKKGPGRGKKKVMFTHGGDGAGDLPLGSGEGTQATPSGASLPQTTAAGGAAGGDIIMVDAADAEEEDEDEGEEGEEGDESDENDDREEGELSPSPEPITKAPVTSMPEEKQPAIPAPTTADSASSLTPQADSIVAATPPLTSVVDPIASPGPPSVPANALPPRPPPATEPEALAVIKPDTAPRLAEIAEESARSRREPSSSPELPLAMSHSRHGSMNQSMPSGLSKDAPEASEAAATVPESKPAPVENEATADDASGEVTEVRFQDGEVDLFGSLERHLEQDTKGTESKP